MTPRLPCYTFRPPQDDTASNPESFPAARHAHHHAPPPPPGKYRPAGDFDGSHQQQFAEADLSAVRAFNSVNGTTSSRAGENGTTRSTSGTKSTAATSQPILDFTPSAPSAPPNRFNVDAVMFDRDGNIIGGDEPTTFDNDNDPDDDDDHDDPPNVPPNNAASTAATDDGPVTDPGAPAPSTDSDVMPPPPSGTLHISREALLKAANLHARKYGYALSIKKSTASGQKVVITCTREGRPMNSHHLTDESRVRKGRVSKRSGCRMKIAGNRIKVRRMLRDERAETGQRVATEEEGGPEAEVWRLRVINAEHNHGPDDDARMNPIHRKMSDDVKEAIAVRLMSGLKVVKIFEELASQFPGLTATQQDVRNEVARIRKAKKDLDPETYRRLQDERARERDQIRAFAQQQLDEGMVHGQQEEDRRGLNQVVEREPPRINAQGRVLSHVHPTEQERTAIAILKAEMANLEQENQRLKESGATERANAESGRGSALRSENERLKEEIAALKAEVERYKSQIESERTSKKEAETRLDELRAMLDRYLMGGMGAPNTGLAIGAGMQKANTPVQNQPQQPQQPQPYANPSPQQNVPVQQFQSPQPQQYATQHQQFTTVNGTGASYNGHYPQHAQHSQPHGNHPRAGGRMMTGMTNGADWRR